MSQPDPLGPQLPLALRYPPEQRFETWLDASPTGIVARLRALAKGEPGDPLYLQGGNASRPGMPPAATSSQVSRRWSVG